jgi:hypothetical protein
MTDAEHDAVELADLACDPVEDGPHLESAADLGLAA